ncbi:MULTISPECIES: topoisomerase DNA-binding C4 zinc finger domain-containing protein [Paenibacillus]|nr:MULTISPECIES: topoisomerase DNA-binding C4 zinc finger domain-containing protein [Paenibacillus]
MVRRKGPKSDFYGCSKYPKCRSIAQFEVSR